MVSDAMNTDEQLRMCEGLSASVSVFFFVDDDENENFCSRK